MSPKARKLVFALQFPRLEISGFFEWVFGEMADISSVVNTGLRYFHSLFCDIKRGSKYPTLVNFEAFTYL